MIELAFSVSQGDFSLEVAAVLPQAGVTGVFGRSGAGKSTLIKALAGISTTAQGRIKVGDEVFLDTERGWQLPVERRRVGYVFQDARLFPHMRIETNLRYGARRRSGGESSDLWQGVIEVLDLQPLLSRWPGSLSGGERQRVAIGRALLSQPQILLMDEPLASLDAPRKTEILYYIERLREAYPVPVLYVTHSLDELVRIADHLLLLSEGKVIACGPFLDLVGDTALQPFLGRFEAGSVLECVLEQHDETFGLSVLSFSGGELRVPKLDAPCGTRLRARLRGRDVAIALKDPPELSITNRVQGEVLALSYRDGPYVDVLIGTGNSKLHALITRESCARLNIHPGLSVIALIKAVALDSRTVGYSRRAR